MKSLCSFVFQISSGILFQWSGALLNNDVSWNIFFSFFFINLTSIFCVSAEQFWEAIEILLLKFYSSYNNMYLRRSNSFKCSEESLCGAMWSRRLIFEINLIHMFCGFSSFSSFLLVRCYLWKLTAMQSNECRNFERILFLEMDAKLLN